MTSIRREVAPLPPLPPAPAEVVPPVPGRSGVLAAPHPRTNAEAAKPIAERAPCSGIIGTFYPVRPDPRLRGAVWRRRLFYRRSVARSAQVHASACRTPCPRPEFVERRTSGLPGVNAMFWARLPRHGAAQSDPTRNRPGPRSSGEQVGSKWRGPQGSEAPTQGQPHKRQQRDGDGQHRKHGGDEVGVD